MWKGNTAPIYSGMRLTLVKIYYFEEKDAPLYTRILCQLPGAFSAIIELGKAILVAQFSCSYEKHIMRQADTYDIGMPRRYYI